MALSLGSLAVHLRIIARRREESLGLILGRGERASLLVGIRNVARNKRVEFLGDPWATIAAHAIAENLGLEVLGVYHTHPCGTPRPSRRDLEGMKAWPYIWVIASPTGLKAWIMKGGEAREVPVA